MNNIFTCASLSSTCTSVFVNFVLLQILIVLKSSWAAHVVPLDSSNFQNILNTREVVFVNFYANWCRFSQLLEPVFEEAASKFVGVENVVFGGVDCDSQGDIAQMYQISKYPTLKLFRAGKVSKREYRSSRTPEAMAEFIKDQLKDVVKRAKDEQELQANIDRKKRTMVAYLINDQVPEWYTFKGLAGNLKEDCQFHVLFGTSQNVQPDNVTAAKMVFWPLEGEQQSYAGQFDNSTEFQDWVTNNCIPLVREITFENAEELTEEGLPFLILFKRPEDTTSLNQYIEVVQRMQEHKNSINFLYADGLKFAHPLHHLGKSERDLPLIAIDSFRHMYLFPEFKDLNTPGKLKEFVDDMHSGKLHREFHHGPDATEAPQAESTTSPSDGAHPATDGQPTAVHDHKPAAAKEDLFGVTEKPQTSPPQSVFRLLKPSKARYTLKEEL